MRTVLVTGAGGFVGLHLLPALSERFPQAAVIGTNRSGRDNLLALDVTDVGNLRRFVAEFRPDACIHLAAVASVERAFCAPRAALEVNLVGTLNLAEALLELAPECRLVHASSGEIYGLSFREGPVDEDTALAPANPYAVSKAAADLALGEIALRGLKVVRLRLFNHTGPGQTEAYVLPRFAAQVARIEAGRQQPVIYTGALDRWRDFLDVRDVVAAYLAALAAPVTGGLCVNICSGTSRRIGDALHTLLELARVNAEVVERVSEARSTDVRMSLGSPRRAEQALSWRPQVPWPETLQILLAYWRTNTGAEPRGVPC
jgi:GDP-4-dehydro-6-deoxy-D-mannose reductase